VNLFFKGFRSTLKGGPEPFEKEIHEIKGGLEPLGKEIYEILGSKREHRFSSPFFGLVQKSCQIRFSTR